MNERPTILEAAISDPSRLKNRSFWTTVFR